MSLIIFFGFAGFIFILGMIVIIVTFHHWITSAKKQKQTTQNIIQNKN